MSCVFVKGLNHCDAFIAIPSKIKDKNFTIVKHCRFNVFFCVEANFSVKIVMILVCYFGYFCKNGRVVPCHNLCVRVSLGYPGAAELFVVDDVK